MRIIAGEHKGRRLVSPRGQTIRPTADRVRETIFNLIAPSVAGATVLDLFAGSGALALEALSRGATRAVCVDNSRHALELIQRNAAQCGCGSRLMARRANIAASLSCLKNLGLSFDLIFMDPPYRKNLILPALKNLLYSPCLAPQALIVIEHDGAEPVDITLYPTLTTLDRRCYGQTRLTLIAHAAFTEKAGL